MKHLSDELVNDIVHALNMVPNTRVRQSGEGLQAMSTYDIASRLGQELSEGNQQERSTGTITNPITDQMREDLLITAYEGGSTYWAALSPRMLKKIDAGVKELSKEDKAPSERMWAYIKKGGTVYVHDAEGAEEGEKIPQLGKINLESIAKGEALFIKDHARHFGNLISEDWDAETADVWFQLCVLGDVVYG